MTIRLILLAWMLLCSQAASASGPLRALILTSPGVYHNYQYQNVVLANGISAHANVQFEISLAQLERWQTTDFGKDYDVLVYNICMADNRDAQLIANLRRQTEELAIPALVIHCTMHSFRETELWWPFYGLKTVAHEHLKAMTQRHAREHPILSGIPTDWVAEEDELYINLAFEGQSLLVSGGEDGADHTTAWLQQQGETWLFGTTLGHSDSTMEDPVFQRLLANALLYVTGNLDAKGKPLPALEPDLHAEPAPITVLAPEGVRYLGEDGQSCVMRQFARAIGPCYLGCSLHPFKWGEQARACKDSCAEGLPSSDSVIAHCSQP